MIAMMLPSSWPMLELYSRSRAILDSGIHCLTQQWWEQDILPRGAFRRGRVRHWFLNFRKLPWPLSQLSHAIPAAAGVAWCSPEFGQLTPSKQTCLRHCRDPLLFPLMHTSRRVESISSWMHHGMFCAACCWALMLCSWCWIMNLGVMAVIAAIMPRKNFGVADRWWLELLAPMSIAAGADIGSFRRSEYLQRYRYDAIDPARESSQQRLIGHAGVALPRVLFHWYLQRRLQS